MEEKYQQLVIGYLTRQLTSDEYKELKSWLLSSQESRDEFRRYCALWVSDHPSRMLDADKAFQAFKNRTETSSGRVLGFRTPWWKYAAAVVLLGILFITAYTAYEQGSNSVIQQLSSITIESPGGSASKVTLPDGSFVWLNGDSKLTYSQRFGVGERNVKLEGEGYFEVRHNKKLPFIVITEELQVRVLGTKFTFKNYPDEATASVALLEGKVALRDRLNSNQEVYLSPNEKYTLDKLNHRLWKESVQAGKTKLWIDGILYFEETPLPDVMNQLGRKYGYIINVERPELKNIRLNGEFDSRKGVEEVLQAFSMTEHFKYKIHGKNINIY